MGFLRNENIKMIRKKSIRPKKKLDLDEQIAHAICALGQRTFFSHYVQRELTNWITENYGTVNPETVQRVFRRMVNDPAHIIKKEQDGRFVRYEINKLFDLRLDEDQLRLF